MKRKIIRLGTATNVISLPSKWTKKLGLKPGDEVETIEDGNSLSISSGIVVDRQSATIKATNLGSMINYSILALYIRGIDELRVESDDSKIIEKLQEHPLPELIGWEIIEQSKSHCLIKDVSGHTEMDIDSILSRIMMLIQNMADELEKGIKTGITELGHIDSIDVSANRFINLYARRLHKSGHADPKKTAVMFYILTSLESIGDSYSDAATYITMNKIHPGKLTTTIIQECNDFLRDYRKILLDFKIEDAVALDARFRKFKRKVDMDINAIKNPKELRCLAYFSSIIDGIVTMMRNQLIISLKDSK